MMRHASLASTQIYKTVDEDERRDAIRRLVAWVVSWAKRLRPTVSWV